MNKANGPVDRIKTALGAALLAALTGCLGYVGASGDYGGTVVVSEPDVILFGGYERGREVRDYGHRGFESRGAAHPQIRASVHPGGGGHERKR